MFFPILSTSEIKKLQFLLAEAKLIGEYHLHFEYYLQYFWVVIFKLLFYNSSFKIYFSSLVLQIICSTDHCTKKCHLPKRLPPATVSNEREASLSSGMISFITSRKTGTHLKKDEFSEEIGSIFPSEERKLKLKEETAKLKLDKINVFSLLKEYNSDSKFRNLFLTNDWFQHIVCTRISFLSSLLCVFDFKLGIFCLSDNGWIHLHTTGIMKSL